MLVDRINGFERHAHLEHRTQLTRIHDINEYIARTKRTAGQVTVLIRIFHLAVVQIMETYREIVWLVRFTVSLVGFLDLRPAEVMTVESGTEHRTGQVIREVELQHLMGVGMQQGGVAHT